MDYETGWRGTEASGGEPAEPGTFPRVRPALGGLRIESGGRWGTLGCLVSSVEESGPRCYILTVSHLFPEAEPGQPVYQPHRDDANIIGTLKLRTDLKPYPVGDTETPVGVDAAVLLIKDWQDVTHGITGLGPIRVRAKPREAEYLQVVYKMGAATGETKGYVSNRRLQRVRYRPDSQPDHEVCLKGQMEISPDEPFETFAAKGDSGAVLVDDKGYAVGLLTAIDASGALAYATPIDRVLAELRVDIVGIPADEEFELQDA